MAGDMKELRKPWKIMIEPRVKRPCMVSQTPSTMTAALAIVDRSAGMPPRNWLRRMKRTFCAFTDAW